LKGKHDLQGILNAGYNRKTAYVLRVAQQLPASESNGKLQPWLIFPAGVQAHLTNWAIACYPR